MYPKPQFPIQGPYHTGGKLVDWTVVEKIAGSRVEIVLIKMMQVITVPR